MTCFPRLEPMVFCGECRHAIFISKTDMNFVCEKGKPPTPNELNGFDSVCGYPLNILVLQDWLMGTQWRERWRIQQLNRLNDCQWFERYEPKEKKSWWKIW